MDYGIGKKMTRAKTPFDGLRVVSTVEPQRAPSINKITNSKLEIRNKWKAKFKARNPKIETKRENSKY